jgi:HEAT repeat protein
MLKTNLPQGPYVVLDGFNTLNTLPIAVEVQPNPVFDRWISDLSPEVPWGNRKIAAQKLGYLRDPGAVPALLAALVSDPFWMVRCAIIQALELIADPGAIATLRKVAREDSFQVVRSYAARAIERLS